MTLENPDRLSALLDLALASDPVALNGLLEKLRPYLMMIVRRRRSSGRGHRLGDSDLVQETLMRIHRGLDAAQPDDLARFRGEGVPQLLGWVGTIVGHVVIDAVRHNRAELRDEGREVSGTAILAMLKQSSSPVRLAERAEQAVLLVAALERLPEHQRDVLHRRFFDRLSFAEISETTSAIWSSTARRMATKRSST
jgi:RNA polymerase sigma factor (sigma-70 family)